ncbi:MAG: sugar phosphate nucleotidyltransferase [Methanobacteriota archaeon]
MQAIILAGGHAKRLWPLTLIHAKPLLPIGDRPIVEYFLRELAESRVVSRIVLATNEKYAADFEAYVASRKWDAKVRVRAERQRTEAEKPGAIAAIRDVLSEIGTGQDTLIVGGDNVASFSLTGLAAFGREKRGSAVAGYDVGDRERARLYGIGRTAADGRLVEVQEKPAEPASTLALTACYFLTAADVQKLGIYVEEVKGQGKKAVDAPGNFIAWLAARSPVYLQRFQGYWFDIGSAEGYLEAHERILGERWVKGKVDDEKRLGRRVFVYPGAEVEESTLSDTVVLEGARVSRSTLRNTILGRDSVVEGLRLTDSIVGDSTRLLGDK